MFRSVNDIIKLIGSTRRRSVYVFSLDGLDILRQLRFEEFIYRNVTPMANDSSFFLVNSTHVDRSVVFGLSGNPIDHIKDFGFCKDSGIKLIKRFSGGGTVLIDENTVTASFIGTHTFAPSLKSNQICKWTFENVYIPCKIFKSNFGLVDGDFVVTKETNSNSSSSSNHESDIDDKEVYFKVGGNAQAYSKDSFVHHTCFIWKVSPLISRVLSIPKRMPKYRNNRDHGHFLRSVSECLSESCESKGDFSLNLRQSIKLNVTNTLSFKYRPSGIVGDVEFNNEFIDSCIDSLKRPSTNELPY